MIVDALNAANFKVDDKPHMKIHSNESRQYIVTGCLWWINEIQTKFNRDISTRLWECALKDETSHICLTVWGSHIPKFEETDATRLWT